MEQQPPARGEAIGRARRMPRRDVGAGRVAATAGVLLACSFAPSLRGAQVQGPIPQAVSPATQKPKPARDYSISLPPKPDFSALDWLVGDWTGTTQGKGSAGDVHVNVAYALDQRYMVFNEWIALPATKTAPATRESWMGILASGASGSGLVFHSYSSTGFVLRYRVVADGNSVSFFPEGGDPAPTGWLFRRTLTRVAEGAFTETVQAAPPDRPFFDYYAARLNRVAAPPPPPQAKAAPTGAAKAPAAASSPAANAATNPSQGNSPAKDKTPSRDAPPSPPRH